MFSVHMILNLLIRWVMNVGIYLQAQNYEALMRRTCLEVVFMDVFICVLQLNVVRCHKKIRGSVRW